MPISLREQIIAYIGAQFGAEPEYLWERYPDYAVFRHEDNGKWFCVVMDVPREKLGLSGTERADILNVKPGDPFFANALIRKPGYFRGYHIARGNWVSVLLDGTVPEEEIRSLIDESYAATASAKLKKSLRPPKEWLVPANPKYYDIVGAFEKEDEINWKQGNGIRVGDTVWMYVGAPVSAILYRCAVTETDIPYDYADENLTIRALMKIKLLDRIPADRFPFDRLRQAFGVNAVRGPRGIPVRLREALKKETEDGGTPTPADES